MQGDKPFIGDYDGDGKADIAVWRPNLGIWFILPSGSPGTYTATQWGLITDQPVSALPLNQQYRQNCQVSRSVTPPAPPRKKGRNGEKKRNTEPGKIRTGANTKIPMAPLKDKPQIASSDGSDNP
jgi:hypothetical protein